MTGEQDQARSSVMARRAIKDVLVRYMDNVRLREWEAVEAAFLPDAELDYGTPGAIGVHENIALLRSGVEMLTSCSSLLDMQSVIEVDGERARSRTLCLTTHMPAASAEPRARMSIVQYEDDWRRVDYLWRISRRVCHHLSKGWFPLV